jgi:imidazolonepropionase-like amidohydrolase
VAVTEGVIVELGAVGDCGRREINADGAVVTPGFIDIHTPLRRPGHLGRPAAAVLGARCHHRDDG